MDPVIHFEIPADDSERARRFYESAFRWQTTPLGADMGDFVLACTIETNEATRIPKKPGAINGGFYRRTEPHQAIQFTILVEDIQQAMKKVERAGGKVLGEPFELPGLACLQHSWTPRETSRNSIKILSSSGCQNRGPAPLAT